jgi:hypothetical protein
MLRFENVGHVINEGQVIEALHSFDDTSAEGKSGKEEDKEAGEEGKGYVDYKMEGSGTVQTSMPENIEVEIMGTAAQEEPAPRESAASGAVEPDAAEAPGPEAPTAGATDDRGGACSEFGGATQLAVFVAKTVEEQDGTPTGAWTEG